VPDRDGYKWTSEVRQQFLEMLAGGCSQSYALKKLGISRYCLYDHMNLDPMLREEIKEAKAMANEQVKDMLFDKAMNGNVTAIIFWLCNNDPEHWRRTDPRENGYSEEAMRERYEQLVELALKRIPETERNDFIDELRQLAGLAGNSSSHH